MLEKVMRLFESHLKVKHNIVLYEYQKIISLRIFKAIIDNLRFIASADPEAIKKLNREEIVIEISRQAGKTTDVVATIEYVIAYLAELFEQSLATGIFAPQREQSKTDFDRLKALLRKDSDFVEHAHLINDEEETQTYGGDIEKAKEESNARTLVLPNGSSCYVFPITPTSKPESKTLDLIVIEEAQDADDKIIKEQILPMGAATNAPIIYIGTAGTRICQFYRLGQQEGAIKIYYPEIVKHRREVYEKTGDVRHLLYERNVDQLIEKYGIESDEVQRPYFGKWLIGTGQFTTQEDLEAITDKERSQTNQDKTNDCYVGIDVAKSPDSTVVMVLRKNKETGLKEVINWIELRGERYNDQFDIIKDFLSRYKVVAVALDATGAGDPFVDHFRNGMPFKDENSGLYPIKFSAPSKDNMYRNLKVSIKELLTRLPNLDTKKGERFKLQMLDLQQEYKGQLLRVNHPDAPDAHDDYPDAWALAEWAYAKYNENKADVTLITIAKPKQRDVVRDAKGNITDAWISS